MMTTQTKIESLARKDTPHIGRDPGASAEPSPRRRRRRRMRVDVGVGVDDGATAHTSGSIPRSLSVAAI